MNWLEQAIGWVRSFGGGHDRLESLSVAVAGLLVAAILAALTLRLVLPALFRFAHEEAHTGPARRIRLATLILVLLMPVLVYIVDRNLEDASFAHPFTAATVMLIVYLVTEGAILLAVGILARAEIGFPVLFRDVVRIIVYVIAFMAVLKSKSIFGVDLGALLGASAIFSVIIGLAVQEPLGSLFAGLFMQIDRPLKVGDWVLVNGEEGKVAEMNWRSTRLVTRANDNVIIPNSAISKADIKNYSTPTALHRVQRKIGVSYASQPNKVKKVLTEMLLEVQEVLHTPAPEVYLLSYGDFAIDYELRYWIKDFEHVSRIDDEVMTGIWYQFRRHGIEIPFPVRDVTIRRERRREGADPEVLSLLSRVDFLAPLTEPEVRGLAEDLRHHIYARGERVFEQGEEGHTFYIIWKGHVAVRVKNDAGAEIEVAQLERGNYFGEMSLLTGEARTATVVAMDDCDVLELDRSSFSEMLRMNPDVAETMSSIIARRSAATREKVDEAVRHSTRVRIQRDEDLSTMTKKILTGIRGIFGFKPN